MWVLPTSFKTDTPYGYHTTAGSEWAGKQADIIMADAGYIAIKSTHADEHGGR